MVRSEQACIVQLAVHIASALHAPSVAGRPSDQIRAEAKERLEVSFPSAIVYGPRRNGCDGAEIEWPA